MKILEVEVRMGVTRNLGNYESLRLDEGVRLQVDEGEKPSEIIDKGKAFLEEKVNKDADEIGKRIIQAR